MILPYFIQISKCMPYSLVFCSILNLNPVRKVSAKHKVHSDHRESDIVKYIKAS